MPSPKERRKTFEAAPLVTITSEPISTRQPEQWPEWLQSLHLLDEGGERLNVLIIGKTHKLPIAMPEDQLRMWYEASRYAGSVVVDPNGTGNSYARFKGAYRGEDLFTLGRIPTEAGEHQAVKMLRETSMVDLRPGLFRIKDAGASKKAAWPRIAATAALFAGKEALKREDGKLPCGVTVLEYLENLEALHAAVIASYAEAQTQRGGK